MLRVCELFKSIQGESTYTGRLCSFVRLTGCNLRCRYCDTSYSLTGGDDLSITEIVRRVRAYGVPLVEITGGEPLLQAETPELCGRLLGEGYTVLVETNGSFDVSVLPPPVIRIVDVKCPSSGECGSFLEANYGLLRKTDECKFVLSDEEDFRWALGCVRDRRLYEQATVIFSPNIDMLGPATLAGWMVAENAPARLGIQLHKIIWGDKRGV